MAQDCPCGCADAQGRAMDEALCCGQYLLGQAAPNAQALMRSRYTAFVRGNVPYLLATWHASTRPAAIDFDAGTRWLGLQVREHRVVDDTHQEVEFVARSRPAGPGPAMRLHERSRFVREPDGRWYYVDGDLR